LLWISAGPAFSVLHNWHNFTISISDLVSWLGSLIIVLVIADYSLYRRARR
jgi:hypothetical protein